MFVEVKMDYDGVQETLYDLKFSANELKLLETGRRKVIRPERTNPFDFKMKKNTKPSPLGLIYAVLNKKARHTQVKKGIAEEVGETFQSEDSSYKGVFSDQQVDELVEKVTQKTKERTESFKYNLSKTKAIAAEESYKTFSPPLLKSTLKELLPEDSEATLNRLVDVLMSDFSKCLEKATLNSNSEESAKCMQFFAKEAPVQAGEEILKIKLKGVGMEKFGPIAISEYRSCIKEHYDPIYTRVENCKKGKTDILKRKYSACLNKKKAKDSLGLSRVKSCLYVGFIKSIDDIVPGLMADKVIDINKGLKSPIKLTNQLKTSSLKKMCSCLEKNKLTKLDSFNRFTVDIESLDKLSSSDFEKKLLSCSDPVTVFAGRKLSSLGLKEELRGIDGLSETAQLKINDEVLSQGYDRCVARMKKGKAKSLDPGQCVRVMKNLGVALGSEQLIIESIGSEQYNALDRQENGRVLSACFEQESNRLLKEIQGLSGESNKAKTDAMDVISDQHTANCFKNNLILISGPAALDIIKKKIDDSGGDSSLIIDRSFKELVEDNISKCFRESFSSSQSVESVLKRKDIVVENCSSKMLKSDKIQHKLFTPLIKLSIDNAELDLTTEKQSELITQLRMSLIKKVNKTKSQKEIMTTIDDFSVSAVSEVVSFILNDGLGSVLDENEDEKERELEQQNVHDTVMENIFESEVGVKLLAAMKSKDKARIKEAVAATTSKAIKITVLEVIKINVVKIDKGGLIPASGSKEEMITRMNDSFLNCYHDEVNSNPNKKLVEVAKSCILSVKIEASSYLPVESLIKYLISD